MRVEQLTRFATDLQLLAQTGGLATAGEFLFRTAMRGPEVLRSGRLAIVDAEMGRRNYAWQVGGTRVQVPGRFFGGARELYARQVYFAVPGFELRPNDVVVDLGANAGLFTVLAALRSKRVIAVEAQSGFHAEARRILELNRCEDKVAFEFGLIGPRAGVFADPTQLVSSSHFERKPPVVTMEELLDRHRVDHVGFLKCDIEGSEFDLFNTDSHWLYKVDRIAAEVHTEFGDHKQLADLLRSFGFQVTSLDSKLRPLSFPTHDVSTYLFARRTADAAL